MVIHLLLPCILCSTHIDLFSVSWTFSSSDPHPSRKLSPSPSVSHMSNLHNVWWFLMAHSKYHLFSRLSNSTEDILVALIFDCVTFLCWITTNHKLIYLIQVTFFILQFLQVGNLNGLTEFSTHGLTRLKSKGWPGLWANLRLMFLFQAHWLLVKFSSLWF